MKFFHTAGLLVLLLSFCVSANSVSLSGKTYIHCPEQLHVPDSRNQVVTYIEENLFAGRLNRLLLEKKTIGFRYQLSKPGVYESVGGVLEFSTSGNVQSLKCEYFGRGGIDGDVTIFINSEMPYSVMAEKELNTGKSVDCMPFNSDSYGGAEYVPCVIEPEFSLIVSHGPALEVIGQAGEGVQINPEAYVITVTEDASAYYLESSDLGEKKGVSSLCVNSEEKDAPLYVSASEHLLYEFILEPYGQANYLACFKNGQRIKSMLWRARGYDYTGPRPDHQQKDNSHKSETNHDDQGKWGHQSGNGYDRRQDYSAPTTGFKEMVSSKIVYFSALFGLGDFAYQIIGGGRVEKAFAELGLPMHNADMATIKKHCRGIKKKHHPDKGGSAELFNYYVQRCETLLDQ